MTEAGLILEGGGMRGVYTAGVLDFFIDKNITFKSVYGVSAGSCHGCSYISKQRGRAFRVNVDYLKDKRYCSMYSLITTGDLFGARMCYDIIPNKLDPYDYDMFNKYTGDFFAVVTNCESGEAEYIKIKDMKKDIWAVRASSSLPIVSRLVENDGKKYLDGGIKDALPIERSIMDGNIKNVVVLTRCARYVKEPMKFMPVFRIKYRKYPNLVKTIENRHIEYNKAIEFIAREKAAQRAFIIQPSSNPNIGRVEKNRKKLTALYEMGYRDAENSYEDLKEFIK